MASSLALSNKEANQSLHFTEKTEAYIHRYTNASCLISENNKKFETFLNQCK